MFGNETGDRESATSPVCSAIIQLQEAVTTIMAAISVPHGLMDAEAKTETGLTSTL